MTNNYPAHDRKMAKGDESTVSLMAPISEQNVNYSNIPAQNKTLLPVQTAPGGSEHTNKKLSVYTLGLEYGDDQRLNGIRLAYGGDQRLYGILLIWLDLFLFVFDYQLCRKETEMSCLLEKQKKYYFLENQLLLFYEKSDKSNKTSTVCPLCKRYCKKKMKSHIFPNSLWREYSNIHCNGDEDFIYDLSTGEKKRSKGLTYPLLCGICETKASREEPFLRDVYLQIMGLDQDKQLCIKADDADKLKHILAILLFRGIMVGINFWEESKNDYYNKFFENFIDLRNYCTADIKDPKTKEMPVSKRIHLFLLRNSNINPTYILNLQLRTPQYTTIVNLDGKVFLYMKFDCFHCILPITDNCHSLMENSCFASYTKDGIVLPTAKEARFPQILQEFNISKTAELLGEVQKIRFPYPFQCVIQHQLMKRRPPVQETTTESANIDCKQLRESDRKKLREEAKKLSPLVNQTYKPITRELSKEKKAANEKYVHKEELQEKCETVLEEDRILHEKNSMQGGLAQRNSQILQWNQFKLRMDIWYHSQLAINAFLHFCYNILMVVLIILHTIIVYSMIQYIFVLFFY